MLPISPSASQGFFTPTQGSTRRSALLAAATGRMALAGAVSAALWALTGWALGWTPGLT